MARSAFLLVLVAAMAIVAFRLAERNGYNPWLCALLACFIGPVVLIALAVWPHHSRRRTRRGGSSWEEPERPAPPRPVRHATPPPPRSNSAD